MISLNVVLLLRKLQIQTLPVAKLYIYEGEHIW